MTSPSSGPIFPGLAKLIDLVRTLYDRPGVRKRPEGSDAPGDQPLPLIWLVQESGPTGFVATLDDRLSQTNPPRIPHVRVDATEAHQRTRRRWNLPAPDGSADTGTRDMPIMPLLDELAFRLGREKFAGQRLSRFDRYRLIDWLTGQRPEPANERDDRAGIVQILRTWVGGSQPASSHAVSTMDVAPDIFSRLALWGITTLGRVVNSRWLRERVPRLGPERRWLMRQPYLVPRHSVDFLDFAERLTADRRSGENSHQLKKLLVHAFLEDLREGYRRFWWRVLPRPGGRGPAPELTLKGEDLTEANGGWELLQLINEVRNETGQLDPLLVVAETGQLPTAVRDYFTELVDPDEVDDALKMWRNRLPGQRQLLADNARHLMVRLPEPVPVPMSVALSAADRGAWDKYSSFQPKRPPWFVRRRIATSMIVLAVLAAGWFPVITSWQYIRADCATRGVPAGWWPGAIAVEPTAVPHAGVQCLGYSDSTRFVFGTDNRLRKTQRLVFVENERARELHRQRPDRPLVTLIYFSILTHKASDLDSDHAVAEELEGLLLRQWENNTASSLVAPLLRIVVANAGTDMKQAPLVVERFLLPLLADDPTIVGVVGLDRTVRETEIAISELGLRAGVPTIGTTLTGEGLTRHSPTYFQMVPANAKQAELVRTYADQIGVRKIDLYYPESLQNDSYLQTLVEAFKEDQTGEKAAGGSKRNPAVRHRPWQHAPNNANIICDRSAMAFFAGREADFKGFLAAMNNRCVTSPWPVIVGNDAVSRFIAIRKPDELADVAGIAVSYVALGGPVVLAGKQCLVGIPSPASGGGRSLDSFCHGYSRLRRILERELAEPDRPASRWPGEQVGIAYDSAGLFLHAVEEVRTSADMRSGVTPHRGALAQKLRETKLTGATGPVDFTRNRDGADRILAMLRVVDISNLTGEPVCVFMTGLLPSTVSPENGGSGCPQGTG